MNKLFPNLTDEEVAEMIQLQMKQVKDVFDIATGALAHGEMGLAVMALSRLEEYAKLSYEAVAKVYPIQLLAALPRKEELFDALEQRMIDAGIREDLARLGELIIKAGAPVDEVEAVIGRDRILGHD